MKAQSLLERYRDVLPVTPSTPIVTLGEGSTPLVRAPHLSRELGLDVWLKCEGANPTGSFKDRGMAIALAKALEAGVGGVVCASTGNTAASAAAYAARAGLHAIVVHSAGAVAAGKLAQARAAGATLTTVEGAFDEALEKAAELADERGYTLVNSVNPDRLEGQKTAALEILDELGPPDAVALPYGGGGNTVAYARGFGQAGARPRLFAVGATDRARTAASAIRIAHPVHHEEVGEAVGESGGAILAVGDPEITAAWRTLARSEGIFCEPASAAGVAGLAHAKLPAGARVVCVLTGHGLKDVSAVGEWTVAP